jgi:Lrp/AsnC family transcriptional regulator, regulator for asnA, asnC and gidA
MSENDEINLKIIDILMEDGRLPAAEIARRIGGGISERIVRYRIEQMIRDKVMQVRPIVNPQAFGMVTRADVVLQVDSDAIMDVAQKLMVFNCVSYVACSIGEMDVSVQIVAKNTDEIYRFVTEVIGKIPGVRKTATSIVPLVLKDVYQWRMPHGNEPGFS